VFFFGLLHYKAHLENPQLSLLTGAGFAAGSNNLRCSLAQSPPLWLMVDTEYQRRFTMPLWNCSYQTWLAGVGLAFFFAIWANIQRVRFEQKNRALLIQRCALQIEGLPRSAVVTKEVEKWLEELTVECGHKAEDVVGVSIAYNLSDETYDRCKKDAERLVANFEDPDRELALQNKKDKWITHFVAYLEGSGYAVGVFSSSAVANDVCEYLLKKNLPKAKKQSPLIYALTGRRLKRQIEGEIMLPLLGGDAAETGRPFHAGDSSHKPGKHFPVATPLIMPPEAVHWQNYGMELGEVFARIKQMPGRILMSIVLTLMFFLPSLLFFSKNARLQSAMQSDLLFKAKTQVLSAIYNSSNNVIVATAMSCAGSFGALLTDGEDLIALCLVCMSFGALTFVNITFTVLTLLPAFLDHMAIIGQKPTVMDAAADVLFTLIVPSLILIRYIIEPQLKYLYPFLAKRFILPRLLNKSAQDLEKMLKWPEINPVWQYADLVVNTSLCITIFFFISPKAWLLLVIHGLILVARYFWMVIIWAKYSTQRRSGTDKLFKTAMALWGVPTGFLAMAMGYWKVRHEQALKLAPLGLPNGPTSWDPKATTLLWSTPLFYFFVHLAVYLFFVIVVAAVVAKFLLKFCGCMCKTKAVEEITYYEDAKKVCPCDFFNTNLPLVLASHRIYGDKDEKLPVSDEDYMEMQQRIPKCVIGARKPLMPFVYGKEYQQGSHFAEYFQQESQQLAGEDQSPAPILRCLDGTGQSRSRKSFEIGSAKPLA